VVHLHDSNLIRTECDSEAPVHVLETSFQGVSLNKNISGETSGDWLSNYVAWYNKRRVDEWPDRLCGLVVRVPGYTTEIYRDSCEVRTEFIYVV
jgi:hypothetical protein